MASVRLAIRRSLAHAGLLSAVCAVTMVVTSLVAGLLGYLDVAANVNTREFVSAASPTASGIRIETKRGSDALVQSEQAEALIHRHLAGVPFSIERTLTDYPLPATHNGEQVVDATGNELRVTPAADAALTEHARLVAGAWPESATGIPEGSIPGALQADAAALAGLAVGDTINLGAAGIDRLVTIVATWLPLDPHDPRWFSDRGVLTGSAVPAGDGTPSAGPLMVSEDALASLGPVPFVRWTVLPERGELTPTELDTLARFATDARQAIIDSDSIGKGDVVVSGTITQTNATVQRGLASVQGVAPVGILLVSLIGLIALLQLARLLSLDRRPHNALLRSRGASSAWLTTAGVVEAAVVATIGAAVGFAVAVGVLFAIFGAEGAAMAPWEYAVVAAVAVVAVFGITALLDSLRIARRDAVDDSGRARSGAALGVTVIVTLAAGVAVWQSLLYGSPLVTSASGRTIVDPLVVSAPTLALVAVALLLLVAFGPLTALRERFAAHRPRFQPAYSARQVARGLASYAVAVLVIALSMGGLTLASGYAGTWADLGGRASTITAGAPVRAILTENALPEAGSLPEVTSELVGVDGITAAAAALSAPITIGDNDAGVLTALPSDRIAHVMDPTGGDIRPQNIAKALSGFVMRGIELPRGATSATVDAVLEVSELPWGDSPASGFAQSTLWFMNSEGAIASTNSPRLGPEAAGSTTTLSIELPASDSAWWLVAIDYTARSGSREWSTTFSNLVATVDGAPTHVSLATTTWSSQIAFTFSTKVESTGDGLTVGVGYSGARQDFVRFMDMGARSLAGSLLSYQPAPPVKFVVSREVAQRYDLATEKPLDLRFEGTGLVVKGIVGGIEPLLPGPSSPNQVFADSVALNDYLLRFSPFVPQANQVWLATDATIAPGAPIGDLNPIALVTPANALDQSFSQPGERSLWIAALGCLVLAAISLGAVTLTLARARRGEVMVLRAVGISARSQSRSRLGELLSVILTAVLFGILGGALVAALTIPNLATSAVTGIPRGLGARLEFDWILGGVLTLLGVAVMAALAVAYSLVVRRQALDTEARLETR